MVRFGFSTNCTGGFSRKLVALASIASAFAFAQPASAAVVTATINFNEIVAGTHVGPLSGDGTGITVLDTRGVSWSYNSVSGFGGAQVATNDGSGNIYMADPNVNDANGAAAALSIGGAQFSVLSMDVRNFGSSRGGGFGGLFGSGYRVGLNPGNVTLDPFPSSSWTTFNFGSFQNITAFDINIVSNPNAIFGIDNIVVQYDTGSVVTGGGTVPEPGSLALLGVALLGMGGLMRKKAA